MTEKYNCLECGKCCKVFLIFENLTETEIGYYSLRFDEGKFKQLKGNTYAYIKECPAYDFETWISMEKGVPIKYMIGNKKTCQIYQNRPTFCRKFKVGSKFCELCRLLED